MNMQAKAVAATLFLAGGLALSARPAPVALKLTGGQTEVVLKGPYDSARLLLEAETSAGARDISASAKVEAFDPDMVTITDGVVRGKRDGKTLLLLQYEGQQVTLPVTISGCDKPAAPRFISEVVPTLTRLGCNQGGCHGAAQGKGGFKLSLQGYDPQADWESITRAAAGRRVTPAQPENSLLLRKPTGVVPHKGGMLLRPGDPNYNLLVDWLSAGMPGPKDGEPEAVSITVEPPLRDVTPGKDQAFRALATFSDNSVHDVTEDALFSVSDPSLASVTPEGVAKLSSKGEASVLVRYRDRVATATLRAPFNAARTPVTKNLGPIDRIVEEKLASLGLDASPKCSDEDFIRRATLDTIGLLPTPDEVRGFLADKDTYKREKLIEKLLNRPEFVDYWTLKWGDLLKSNRNILNEKGLTSLNAWIRRSVADNKPWDRMARELLTARGSMYEEGPANYFRAAASPDALTEMTSQVFLGVRIQCAKCHNHPYEKWKQHEYYQLAAFFNRVRTKSGEASDERIVYTVNGGETTHPRTGKVMAPTPLGGTPLPANFTGDRRVAFADWLTDPKNPFFARILVNRLWKHFLGQGLIEPVDDVRITNPPSNEALLDHLAKDFVAHEFDIKYAMRQILRSKTYQRSSLPTKTNVADTKFYSRFYFKRLDAEPLLDAVGQATGMPEKFAGVPAGVRAAELPDTTSQSYFLDLFGRPARNVVCQCERLDAPSMGQLLHFMNGKDVSDKITAKDGRITRLIAAKATDDAIVEELYLATLSRFPEPTERVIAKKALTEGKDKQKAAEDVLWALLNAKEFLFNH
ncbi:MAG: DUF1553 domain-containing protein [Armatimonas sp.]